ncbi:MAG TPA: glycosyltransferase family 4 protein [Polyangiaceae bacterium]|nr:glycosyltransferase family 4 protein [Polyangiaceae bacterium]
MRSGYKIAIVSDWYLPRIGGLELHLRDLARELNARGHEAHVITATPGPDELDGVKVHRLDVPLMPGLDTIRSKKALVPLEALFVREGYDIIHAHTALSPLAIGATHVAKKLRIPSVMTEHSVLKGKGQALLTALHKIWGWADWADVLSAVSHYVAKEMREVSGRKDVYVLPNGVNPREWKSAHPARGGEPLRVTTVMRFTKRKKPHAIIQAIPKINALLPAHIRPIFTLVGDGPEREHVEREIRRLGVASQVELTGFRPRHEIREILARSSLFILPTSKEALSIATLEARCCGLPVVAMNHGGVGDLIKNGREGYLANTREEFIARIAEVMGDDALRARMSAATKRSLDWFAWDSVIAQHMHVYRLAYEACHGMAPSLRVWKENEALRERLA